MTRQSWTAVTSAAFFVVLSLLIALLPVPFVTWSPGSTVDLLGTTDGQPLISISGAKVHPTTGELRLTTVAVTAPNDAIRLPELVFASLQPDHQVLPRAAVYRPGQDANEVIESEARMMVESQENAVVAGLRQSGVEVTTWPMVVEVSKSGAAAGALEAGDLIKAVDGKETRKVDQVAAAVAEHHVGDPVVFTVQRNGLVLHQTVTTKPSSTAPDKPGVGIKMAIGYSYAPEVRFGIKPSIGGPSAGLMFALAISDKLVSADLVAGRIVAGTGTVDAEGRVGAVGGVREKLAGAARDQASVFLLPKQNCAEIGTVPAGVRLVPVTSLAEATDALARLGDPAEADSVVGC